MYFAVSKFLCCGSELSASDLLMCSELVNGTAFLVFIDQRYINHAFSLGSRWVGVTGWNHKDDSPCHSRIYSPLLGEQSACC